MANIGSERRSAPVRLVCAIAISQYLLSLTPRPGYNLSWSQHCLREGGRHQARVSQGQASIYKTLAGGVCGTLRSMFWHRMQL